MCVAVWEAHGVTRVMASPPHGQVRSKTLLHKILVQVVNHGVLPTTLSVLSNISNISNFEKLFHKSLYGSTSFAMCGTSLEFIA